MNGKFRYIDHDGEIKETFDTNLIPATARDITMFKIDPPPQPHSEEDHEMIARIAREFECVKQRVYGES